VAKAALTYEPLKIYDTNLGWLGVVLISILGWFIYQFIDNQFLSIAFFLSVGIWGLIMLVRTRLDNWFCAVVFLMAAESILRKGMPIGYLFFYHYLIVSFILYVIANPKTVFESVLQRRIVLFSFIITLLYLLNPSLGGGYVEGIRKWLVIWLGVGCGTYLCASLRLQDVFVKSLDWLLAGSMLVILNFLSNPVYKEGRYFGTFDGPGPIAAIAGVMLIVLLIRVLTIGDLKSTLFIAAGILAMVALLMTASRGTAFAVVGSVTIWLVLFKRTRLIYKLLSLVVFIGFIQFGISLDKDLGGTLTSRVDEALEEDTREGRVFINLAVYQSFLDRPILGGGTGSWKNDQGKYLRQVFDRRIRNLKTQTDTHNTFLQFIYEHGMVGFILILFLFYYLFRRLHLMEKDLRIPLLLLLIYSFLLGMSTMHKQAPMFIPFFLAAMKFGKLGKRNEAVQHHTSNRYA